MARIATLVILAVSVAALVAYVAKPLGFPDGGFW